MAIHVFTDSASDIVGNQNPNLTVLPITITFDGTEYKDGVTLSHTQFYEKLIESDNLPTTSQISPYDFEQAIRPYVEQGDDVVIVTMSSKLSGTFQSANIAADEFEGHAFVVDSKNVSVGEHVVVEQALRLIEQGKSASEIARICTNLADNVHIIALLDTLEYLKKGGRISKVEAFAGNMLSIKPVVGVVDGEVKVLGKARGSKQGNNLIAQKISETAGIDFDMPYYLGYTGLSDALLMKYIKDNAGLWEHGADSLDVTTIGGTIGTHVGPGAIAVAFVSL